MEKAGYGRPDLVIADYSRQDQIREMASDLIARYSHLDVLVNNAGHLSENPSGDTGWHRDDVCRELPRSFLLTHLVLPLLRKSPAARIVTVASSAHEDVDRIDWDNMPQEQRYDPWEAYSLSKFSDVAFTYTLARNLKQTTVTANCLHPGVVNTKILRSAFPGMTAITPEEGARTSIYLARSHEVAGLSGRYFDNRRAVRSSALSYDSGVQERLWKMAENLTGVSGKE